MEKKLMFGMKEPDFDTDPIVVTQQSFEVYRRIGMIERRRGEYWMHGRQVIICSSPPRGFRPPLWRQAAAKVWTWMVT